MPDADADDDVDSDERDTPVTAFVALEPPRSNVLDVLNTAMQARTAAHNSYGMARSALDLLGISKDERIQQRGVLARLKVLEKHMDDTQKTEREWRALRRLLLVALVLLIAQSLTSLNDRYLDDARASHAGRR